MQGAGEGRELSITFQTSGKAVRLSAPDKWRKAVVGEDLKPDTWVEIHRQGGAPQTVRADDVPELHALFVDLGLVSDAPAEAPAPPAGEPAADAAPVPPVDTVPPPTATTPATGAATDAAWRPTIPPTPPAVRRRRGVASVIVTIVGVVVVANALRTCGQAMHHHDTSALPGQVSIAVDSSAPVPFPAPPPAAAAAEPSAPAPADAATPATPTEAPSVQAADGPSFDCGRVTSENLKLICATPDLAAADRTLAEAYRQALAATSDPVALRDSERAWIAARNAAATDADQLRALYAERIQALRDMAAAPR